MQFGMNWPLGGRLIYSVASEDQSLEEIARWMQVYRHELTIHGQRPYTHIIVDTTLLNPHVTALEMRNLTTPLFEHPQLGWLIQVNPRLSLVLNILSNTALQIVRARARAFQTLEESLHFLRDVDESFPEITTLNFQVPRLMEMRDWPVPQNSEVAGRRA